MESPVAIVTGGGTGIGAATARRLAGDGNQVVVCGRRPAPLERVAKEIGGLALVVDVRFPAECRQLVSEVVRHFGRVDSLVLNAGVAGYGRVGELSVDRWQETLETNLSGAFYLCSAAIADLVGTGGGVVAVSSIAALRTGPSVAAYSASKAGLIALMRSIAVDYGPSGVRANVVCPGWVRTEMADEEMVVLGSDRELAYRRVTSHVPQRRPGAAEEVAAAIAWLLSGAASYVNGAVLTVDGGTAVVDAGSTEFLSVASEGR